MYQVFILSRNFFPFIKFPLEQSSQNLKFDIVRVVILNGEWLALRLLRAGIHFYLIGIFILTFGIALSIHSSLGASPYDALSVGLFRTFGLTIGSWEIIVGFTLIIFNALAEQKRPEYFALVTSFVTGVGIDFWYFCVRYVLVFDSLIGQAICLIAGIVLTSFGIAIYLQSHIAPNPMDKSMLVISKLTGWKMTYSRLAISIVLVILALIFNGAVGIGTIINALFSGMLINIFYPFAISLRKKSRYKPLAS